jgi:hypothetical protein
MRALSLIPLPCLVSWRIAFSFSTERRRRRPGLPPPRKPYRRHGPLLARQGWFGPYFGFVLSNAGENVGTVAPADRIEREAGGPHRLPLSQRERED